MKLNIRYNKFIYFKIILTIVVLNHLNTTKINASTSNIHKRFNNDNKLSVTKKFVYCNTCGKNIEKNPVLCYIFINYFCSEKCHVQKHKINQNM